MNIRHMRTVKISYIVLLCTALRVCQSAFQTLTCFSRPEVAWSLCGPRPPSAPDVDRVSGPGSTVSSLHFSMLYDFELFSYIKQCTTYRSISVMHLTTNMKIQEIRVN